MVDDPAFAESDVHGGSGVGAVELGDDTVQLLGALGLGASSGAPRRRARRGGMSATQGEWFVAEGPEAEVFARYRDLLADRLGARPARGSRIWCSWYSFYARIDERRLTDVLDGLRGLPFDVFQIDDGWQQAIGDWQANDRFPSGLADLASRSRDHGLEPGLWIAPFLAHANSDLFASNRSMFARDGVGDPLFAGRNWGGECYALDVTHPATQEFISDTISAAVAQGFTYLKLDFLYAAALPGRRHGDVPREQAYRDAIELVRRAAGDDVYLLACGAPIIPSIGVFDGIRVGPDVAPWWDMPLVTEHLHDVTAPATRYAIATSLNRLWLRPAIETDPDVVYFRRQYNLLDRRARTMLQDLARVRGLPRDVRPAGVARRPGTSGAGRLLLGDADGDICGSPPLRDRWTRCRLLQRGGCRARLQIVDAPLGSPHAAARDQPRRNPHRRQRAAPRVLPGNLRGECGQRDRRDRRREGAPPLLHRHR